MQSQGTAGKRKRESSSSHGCGAEITGKHAFAQTGIPESAGALFCTSGNGEGEMGFSERQHE
ncbi:hypothetical protein D3C77_568440 [compost metagenome]